MWFPLPVSLVGQGRVTGHSRGEGSAQPCVPSRALWQVLTKQQQEQAASNDFNFDHPDAFDFDLIIATLKKLKQGKSVKIPIYDFTTHSRKKEWVWDTEGGGTGWRWPGQDRGGAKCTPPAPGLCCQPLLCAWVCFLGELSQSQSREIPWDRAPLTRCSVPYHLHFDSTENPVWRQCDHL